MTTRKGNESIVQKENCFVEEIKEVELRSRRRKFIITVLNTVVYQMLIVSTNVLVNSVLP